MERMRWGAVNKKARKRYFTSTVEGEGERDSRV
jgi:hypothetical protein